MRVKDREGGLRIIKEGQRAWRRVKHREGGLRNVLDG